MKKIPQPLSYQQSNGSCWITSVHNGLLYLLKSTAKIEHFISRMLYIITSSDGTSNGESEILARLINENKKIPVSAKIIRKQSITNIYLRRLLKNDDRVLVCDTLSGRHSILLITIEGNEIIAFDPDWDNVCDCKFIRDHYSCSPYKNVNGFRIFNPYYNARVDINHFLKTRTIEEKDQRFIMGANSSRFIISLTRL